METPRAAPPPATLAKGALRRLAQAQLEPTPENYARAYADEGGQPAPAALDARAQGAAWAALVERLARNFERGGRQWTAARRKESLQRVLDSSRSDAQRLSQRLQSLMSAWESDQPSDPVATGAEDPALEPAPAVAASAAAWPPLVATLEGTVRAGLPDDEPRAAALAAQLAVLAAAVAAEGATPARAAEIDAVCGQARRLFAQRHHLIEALSALCRELSAGLAELTEDDSWARGQCESLQARLGEDSSVRGVRAAAAMLAETRARQLEVRHERQAARDTLKQLIQDMLLEVGELGEQTGRFQTATARHAEAIERADSLESLAGVVKAMLEDSRAVHTAVTRSHERLQADRARASELEARVRELEAELRRLSDEVSTDALTQVANRRGLAQAFEAESARSLRDGGAALAVGLIDIDNFKKLNDSLGHAAGDRALKTLAAAVRERLRPADHLARFGGEEFVVLLPGTEIAEAQQTLTRLQRSLSQSLFMHEGREVFVTFSAGVTAWRPGEGLPVSLERADEALYEAKRTGKNRTCVA
jgi:diguanylate cyclase